jgi:predicted Rossmann fold nucleotide-binding protein DprA/Smf involved in DNA uptake
MLIISRSSGKIEVPIVRFASFLHTLGNMELMALHKVAFVCSRRFPTDVMERSYQWAIAQRESGNCVISGFHSPIEKGVLHHLLAGIQPVIVVMARGINRIAPELQEPLEAGRLLIVSRYAESVTHACEQSCFHRNRLMMELADEIVIAYASPGGTLARLCNENPAFRITWL